MGCANWLIVFFSLFINGNYWWWINWDISCSVWGHLSETESIFRQCMEMPTYWDFKRCLILLDHKTKTIHQLAYDGGSRGNHSTGSYFNCPIFTRDNSAFWWFWDRMGMKSLLKLWNMLEQGPPRSFNLPEPEKMLQRKSTRNWLKKTVWLSSLTRNGTTFWTGANRKNTRITSKRARNLRHVDFTMNLRLWRE